MPVLHCTSIFEGTSYEKIQDTATSFLLLVALHQFLHQQVSFFATFVDFIPHYLKKDFCQEFSFFNRFTQIPLPP